jgi:hypothetical protein
MSIVIIGKRFNTLNEKKQAIGWRVIRLGLANTEHVFCHVGVPF